MSGTDAAWAEYRAWTVKAAQDERCAVLALNDEPPLLDPAALMPQDIRDALAALGRLRNAMAVIDPAGR